MSLISSLPTGEVMSLINVVNDDIYPIEVVVIRFPTRDRPLQMLSSVITTYMTTCGAHYRFPQVHKKNKCCGIWTGDTGYLVKSSGRILNHSHRGKNGPFIICNLHHSTLSQLEWTDYWRKSLTWS